MFTLIIKGEELYDETTNKFSRIKDEVLHLEHSLVSVSKWESHFEKPFLNPAPHTAEETLAYINAMVVTPVYSPEVFARLTTENLSEINDYIQSKHTATTFVDLPTPPGQKQVITAELIYYWMIGFKIPFECQYWHLNKLFALIRICNVKSAKPKNMTAKQIAQRNAQLNAQRRAELGTRG